MGYLRRRVLTAGLVANALRPWPEIRSGMPSFVAGWLTDELAPQLLALTAADTVVSTVRGRASKAGLLVAGGTGLALAHLIRQSMAVKDVAEDALVDGLGGVDYVERLDAAPTPAELATPWRNIARPFRHGDVSVRVERDLPFSEYGGRGTLDIYRPDRDDLADAPVLLQIHGGGWTLGRKDQQGLPLMYRMAAKGWVCVAISYRLAPRDPFPAQIIDVKRAIAWVKEHIADHGGDPSYVAITGGSAGGHLAALAALTLNDPAYQPGFEDADTSVQAAVPFYGVYDWAGSTGLRNAVAMRDGFLGPRIVRQRYADNPDIFDDASPVLRVTADAPDFFVLHGTNDTLVDVGQARLFVERLRELSKAKVVYAELPGAQHAFDVLHSIRGAHVTRAVDRFLTWSWNGHQPQTAAG
ncbi:MAG: alpha/beta hydrolase fold domain-containing protein [Nocardioides sp.]